MGSTQKEPTVEEIAKELDIPREEVVFALDAIVAPVSLYEPIYSDSGDAICVIDQVSDTKNTDESWLEQIALKDAGYNPGTIDGVAGSNTLAACPTLKSGSKGTLVTLLQERLYYFFGLAISGGIDGDFGTGTKNAVISFQKNCGLSADGIVGTNTWRKLLSL